MASLPVDQDPQAYYNLDNLYENTYPGRIIAMGVSDCGRLAIQAYAIMGRSEGSRSRMFVDEGEGSVRTTAPGKSAEEMAATPNAELIYYQASAAGKGLYVVSNGAQTKPIYQSVLSGSSLRESIGSAPTVDGVNLSEYEPDAPNFTPRISGVIDLRDNAPTPVGLAVVRKEPDSDEPIYSTYEADDVRSIVPGLGFVVHTYLSDGDPLPSFDREPFAIRFGEDALETAQKIWRLLSKDNRVALMTRSINLDTKKIEETCILNAPPA